MGNLSLPHIIYCMGRNRDYKNFTEGEIYHVYNRGTGKMDIFLCDNDYRFFMARLNEYISLNSEKDLTHPNSYKRKRFLPGTFNIICYCLMPNHFHILIRQNTEVPISKLIGRLATGYSIYFNKKYSRVGSLFQDQFKAVRIENDDQLRWVKHYILNNPIRAGIWKGDADYPYLRLFEHEGKEGHPQN
jgi:putative transposase